MLRGWAKNLRVPWSPGEAAGFMLLYWIGLQLVLVVPLLVAARFVPEVAGFVHALNQNDPRASFAMVVAEAIGTSGLLWWLLRRRHAAIGDLGWRGFNLWRGAAYVVVALITFYLASNLTMWLIQHFLPVFDVNQKQTNEFTGNKVIRTDWALLALVFIPPIVEETVFRGVLFGALASRWGFWTGAVLSSALFGLAHGQTNVGVYTFILGMLLCWLYARTRSIIPGIILHLINNLLAWLAMTSVR
jgi:membrane protease YdiL (CAAX protease family)